MAAQHEGRVDLRISPALVLPMDSGSGFVASHSSWTRSVPLTIASSTSK